MDAAPVISKTTEAARQAARVPTELRKLPSKLVTTDEANPDAIHKHDAPHIIKGLLKQLARTEAGGTPPPAPIVVKTAAALRFAAMCHDTDGKLPLRQRAIDIIRAKLLAERSCKLLANKDVTSLDFRVRHVWFPLYDRGIEAGASAMTLRDGPAPIDRDRPQALRGLALEIDVLNWPGSVAEGLDPVSRQLNATKEQLLELWNRLRLGLPRDSVLILPKPANLKV